MARPFGTQTTPDVQVAVHGDVPATEVEHVRKAFVFDVDPSDDRGRVLYRHDDGHYGLVEPPGAGLEQTRTG